MRICLLNNFNLAKLLKYLFSIIQIILFTVFSACEKDPSSSKNNPLPNISLNGVFIVNEGSFSAANASLTFYDPETKHVFQNIFLNANGENLGSVANSITINDTLVMIVVNNSDKIEIINAQTFKKVQTINVLPGSSPRNIAVLNDSIIFVSNLYGNSVSVINLFSGQIEKSIPVGANPEGLGISSQKLFVANSGFGFGNTISVISTEFQQFIKTVNVGDNPIALEIDKNGFVFILCSGSYGNFSDPNDDTPGGIWVVDPVAEKSIDSLLIDGHPLRIALGANNNGYFINNGAIAEFNRQPISILNDSLITGNFYGLGFDPTKDEIYALDAKDFLQNGEVIIFNENGEEKNRFPVGLIPGSVGFYYKSQ